MSTTKYTSGPWEYVEYPNGQIEVVADGDVGGVIHQGQIFTEPEDIEEERANAYLIAAAPQQREALENLVILTELANAKQHAGIKIPAGLWANIFNATNEARVALVASEVKELTNIMSTNPIQKKCFNHCPNCGATDPNIEWGDKEWLDTQAYQEAECKKCGCVFKEYYTYSETEFYSDTEFERNYPETDIEKSIITKISDLYGKKENNK